MSKVLDFDKPLSDNDRQHAINRGLQAEVELNEARFAQPQDTGTSYPVQPSTGLTGNEPSSNEATTVTGLGQALQNVDQNTPVPSGENTPTETPAPADTEPGEPGQYEEWTVDQLRAELGTRELSKAGSKAELVARLTADDVDKDGE